jgi:hypothetical protein
MGCINIFIHKLEPGTVPGFVRVANDKYRGVTLTITVVRGVARCSYKLLPSVKAVTVCGGTEREGVCPGGFYLKLGLTWPTN